MKKILVVLLVLGLATASQAGVTFGVNDDPSVTEITLLPSQTIVLDMSITQGGTCSDYTLGWALEGNGEFLFDGATFPNASSYMLGSGFTAGTLSKTAFQMSGSNFGIPVAGPAVIMDGLVVHCTDKGEVVVTVKSLGGTNVDGAPVAANTIMRTILIHQVPEPMTMMLLGLGSLFLVRRKK